VPFVFWLKFDLSGIEIFKHFGVDRNDRFGLLGVPSSEWTLGLWKSLIAIQISSLSRGIPNRFSIDRLFRSRTIELPEERSP
jgi:hypothetical protein